ncbi:hypothetical protein YYE_04637 [Plasmodium vinckei vinckei]|uniref:Uncharacterized protein n=1 Tax=Plasmodium vinckei vinckei TaxID=54757 RepID=A0A081I9U5_PLAVN|nr:hypothetical protein YYE_04637 [Plasmodium vinckei vinckei]
MQLSKCLRNYVHYLKTQNELKQLYKSNNILLIKKWIHVSSVFKLNGSNTVSDIKKNKVVIKNVDPFDENDKENYINQQAEQDCLANTNLLWGNKNIINNMDNQVKNKIEMILHSYRSKKINDCVQEVLEIVNSYPRNKDIYINKNLLLPFYKILIKKRYYLNNLKNNIYENCSINIFDYIHYNINEHLKFYNLKNIHELLTCLSKYLYKNKASLITDDLIKNIFYLSFFSHFNNFIYKTSKQTNYLKPQKGIPLHEYNADTNRQPDIKQSSIEENTNDVPKVCENNELEGRKKRCTYDETFYYLKSYVIFLSNHPKYANKKIVSNILTLANKILHFEINSIMLLSFLSAYLNLLKKYREKNVSNSIFINRNANYHILHTILKDFNLKEIKNKNKTDKIENKLDGSTLCDIEKEVNTNEGYSLWGCSHIINIVKILKIKNILSSKVFESDECEKLLQETFANIINKLDIFYLNSKNNFISLSKNEIDSFFCIYTNLSILLNEVINKRDTFFLIANFFTNSFQTIYIYYNNLHINMLINLLNGIYNQICAYSKIDIYDKHFDNILTSHFNEETDWKKIKTPTHFLRIKDELETEINPIASCLYLVNDIGTCLLSSIQEQNQISLTKLITILNYIHKINKIFLPSNIFNILIFNYLDEIQKIIINYDKRINKEKPENHHILIFMNLYLYYKNENILDLNLLNRCINFVNIDDQNIGTIDETEIVMLLNFFKKYQQIKRKPNNPNLTINTQNRESKITNLKKCDSIVSDNINEGAELFSGNIFKFLNQKHQEYNFEHFEVYIKKCINTIVNKLIFSHAKKDHLKSLTQKIENKTSCNPLYDMQLKIDGNKMVSPHYDVTKFSENKLNLFQTNSISIKNENIQYSINLYFMLYEIYFHHYPITEKQKEVSLSFLTNLINLKKNNLNEENYYHIISCFLNIKNFNHNAYYLYKQYLKNNYKKVNIKYVALIMKKMLEENFQTSNGSKDDTFISSDQSGIIQISKENSTFENIIYLSCNSLICDTDYVNNFRHIKEVLHTYCENYINYYIIRNNFNYFSLSYFNKFIYPNQIKLNKNVMIMLLNTFSNLYYTINKYLHAKKVEKIDGKKNKNEKNEKTASQISSLNQRNSESENINLCRWEKNCEYINKEAGYNDFIKNKLLKNITKIIQKMYRNIKRKNNTNNKISNRDLIDIMVALKNTKSRPHNILLYLSKMYINQMFNNKFIKVDHHVKYMNSIIYLDFLNEANILYISTIAKDKIKITNINENTSEKNLIFFYHILFDNFLKLPSSALFVPNISTYLLNIIMLYFDLLNYKYEKKKKLLTKIIFFIQSLLKLYYVDKVILPNDLDKRNIYLIFLLFSLSNNNKYINISSLPFDTLKLFYNKIILKNMDNLQTPQIYSSFVHHTIYNFVFNFFKEYPNKYKIVNETKIHFYNVDLFIEKNTPS